MKKFFSNIGWVEVADNSTTTHDLIHAAITGMPVKTASQILADRRDNGQSMVGLKLLLDIESQLKGNDSLIAIMVRQASKDNVPVKEIFQTLLDMFRDNLNAIEKLLGMDIINRILNFLRP